MSKDMARRYEEARNKTFYERPAHVQKIVIEEPHGRHAGELAKDAARLAEDLNVEFKVPASGVQ